MVSVEDPEPVMVEALNPPLEMPAGNAASLQTLRLTEPLNPASGVTVTVKVFDWPGLTVLAEGLTEIEKSGVVGVTVMTRVGGLGSEFPLASTTVSDAV